MRQIEAVTGSVVAVTAATFLLAGCNPTGFLHHESKSSKAARIKVLNIGQRAITAYHDKTIDKERTKVTFIPETDGQYDLNFIQRQKPDNRGNYKQFSGTVILSHKGQEVVDTGKVRIADITLVKWQEEECTAQDSCQEINTTGLTRNTANDNASWIADPNYGLPAAPVTMWNKLLS